MLKIYCFQEEIKNQPLWGWFFINFLKHFEAEFSNWQKYRNMPDAARLFCLWSHSSKINKDIALNANGKADTTQPSNEDILMLLIDAAYKISLYQGDQRQNSKYFSNLVEKISSKSTLYVL